MIYDMIWYESVSTHIYAKNCVPKSTTIVYRHLEERTKSIEILAEDGRQKDCIGGVTAEPNQIGMDGDSFIT